MARKEHQQNLLKYYCDKIKHFVPDYEISFEEKYKGNLKHVEMLTRRTEDWLESYNDRYPPEEMTELERRVYDIELWSHGKRAQDSKAHQTT